VRRVLAYVFWHRPAAGAGEEYEAGLRAFQAALRAQPPEGFAGCWTYRPDGSPAGEPWGDAYEDWYLVRDWAALGVLNAGAVDAGHRDPHDAVARLAAEGTAGVYALVAGEASRPRAVRATFDKPPGMAYGAFLEAVGDPGDGGALWQRQMTLGPGPEFRLYADAAPRLPVEASVAALRVV
jgi:hypothetical protein